jgi:2-polyprenyl-3-methyl-5-hydroxy-6-metoxy-1,4-benzoquinol methylase
MLSAWAVIARQLARPALWRRLKMEVLARFNGVHGEISIIQEIGTGARVYHEAGVYQSYVFPGGRAGLSYIRLMRKLLLQGSNALLLGCGGGTLGSELHRNGSAVTIVDNNPISFHIARNFFGCPRASHASSMT